MPFFVSVVLCCESVLGALNDQWFAGEISDCYFCVEAYTLSKGKIKINQGDMPMALVSASCVAINVTCDIASSRRIFVVRFHGCHG